MSKKTLILMLATLTIIIVAVYLVATSYSGENNVDTNNDQTQTQTQTQTEELEVENVTIEADKLKENQFFFSGNFIEKGENYIEISPSDNSISESIRLELHDDVVYRKVLSSGEEKDISKDDLAEGDKLGIFLTKDSHSYTVDAVKNFE